MRSLSLKKRERVLKKADQGYEVDSTADAKEALKKIFEENYDLVLCDYRLPDSSALDILKEMRGKGKDLPFIAVTSSGSEKIAVELMKEGAYDYIVKDSSYEGALPVVIERAQDRYKVKKDKERLEEELKESNKKLQEMYEIKSNFTSMVSHELRTPLTAIKEGIAIVLDGSSGRINDQQKEFLGMAKQNVDRLKRLIDDVLDFSKIEAKKLEFKIKEGNVNEIIKEVVETQKVVAEEKGLYIKTELEPDMPRIEFDPDRINQVLANLVSNAIKFTETGRITISTTKDRALDVITVSVQDTGIGIKEEDRGKLFQKFQQLGEFSKRKTGGTGLGLAISKEIIDYHRGRIWAESEYQKGSTFKFSLPLIRKRKVLIIDDDSIILDVCEKILKEKLFIILRSETAIEGISLAKGQTPDLIILDIRLKDMNGYEVIGRLKSDKDTLRIPILTMTGYIDEIDKMKNQPEELALPCISKPFDNEDFLKRVKSTWGK